MGTQVGNIAISFLEDFAIIHEALLFPKQRKSLSVSWFRMKFGIHSTKVPVGRGLES